MTALPDKASKTFMRKILIQNKIILVISTKNKLYRMLGSAKDLRFSSSCISWDIGILLKISDPKCIERNI